MTKCPVCKNDIHISWLATHYVTCNVCKMKVQIPRKTQTRKSSRLSTDDFLNVAIIGVPILLIILAIYGISTIEPTPPLTTKERAEEKTREVDRYYFEQHQKRKKRAEENRAQFYRDVKKEFNEHPERYGY